MMQIYSVLESCLYCENLNAAREFYGKILGLELFSSVKNRHLFFRCGKAMLMIFNPKETSKPDQDVPSHGSTGPGHIAFAIKAKSLKHWKRHLELNEISIEKEFKWPNGTTSLYFRDPAGNSIELATPRIWGISEEIFLK